MMNPIAHMRSPFKEKFGIPRQPNVASRVRGHLVFSPEYRQAECFRGLEEFSHLWLIWQFHLHGEKWQPTVRPPRLGGNERLGVFATRSSFRPNGLALSVVKIEHIDLHASDGAIIEVSGADLVDGTPIYDVKPYVPYADCLPDACGGFTQTHEWKPQLRVCFVADITSADQAWVEALQEVLAQDPRPAYQDDSQRVYHLIFHPCEVHFRVEGDELFVLSIDPLDS